jgi:DNA repair protein RecO (recombination protein O)
MEWSDDGIILGARRHGESAMIVEAMTRDHGRHLGLVRASVRLSAALQAGNEARLTWRGRLDEHLGRFAVEPLRLRAGALMDSAGSLYGLRHVAGLMRLLPEREPHPALFETLGVVLDHLGELAIAGPLVVRLELALLAELGFGLDLDCCAVTGGTQELVFVSPKSGRAVSAGAGAPYADRLLTLPRFLAQRLDGQAIAAPDLAAAFALTGHFLARDVLDARGLDAGQDRASFITAALTALPPAEPVMD